MLQSNEVDYWKFINVCFDVAGSHFVLHKFYQIDLKFPGIWSSRTTIFLYWIWKLFSKYFYNTEVHINSG